MGRAYRVQDMLCEFRLCLLLLDIHRPTEQPIPSITIINHPPALLSPPLPTPFPTAPHPTPLPTAPHNKAKLPLENITLHTIMVVGFGVGSGG